MLKDLINLFIIYGIAYIPRRSFISLIPKISEEIGLSKHFIARVSSLSNVCYVISKVFGNIVSDYFNPKILMIIYLSFSSLLHFIISYYIRNEGLLLLIVLCTNNLFIGAIWSSIRSLIFIYAKPNERGMYTSVVTNSTIIGSVIIAIMISIKGLTWYQIMFFFGVFIVIDVFIIISIKYEPEIKTESKKSTSLLKFLNIFIEKPTLILLFIGQSFVFFYYI